MWSDVQCSEVLRFGRRLVHVWAGLSSAAHRPSSIVCRYVSAASLSSNSSCNSQHVDELNHCHGRSAANSQQNTPTPHQNNILGGGHHVYPSITAYLTQPSIQMQAKFRAPGPWPPQDPLSIVSLTSSASYILPQTQITVQLPTGTVASPPLLLCAEFGGNEGLEYLA